MPELSFGRNYGRIDESTLHVASSHPDHLTDKGSSSCSLPMSLVQRIEKPTAWSRNALPSSPPARSPRELCDGTWNEYHEL